jgi:hypothetical protein
MFYRLLASFTVVVFLTHFVKMLLLCYLFWSNVFDSWGNAKPPDSRSIERKLKPADIQEAGLKNQLVF